MPFRQLSSDEVSDRAGRINNILSELSVKRLNDMELKEKAESLENIYSSGLQLSQIVKLYETLGFEHCNTDF